MRNIEAIFWKQIKDTFKNKVILIQFVMFPLMVCIMENAVVMEDMPAHFFVKLFSSMYIGMAPLIVMSAIISEEKENGTLKVLLMSDVKPSEYLFGTGIYIWLICMAGSCVFAIVGEYQGKTLAAFLLIMATGIIASLLIGAAIGTWSRTQMMATSIGVPAMMVFAFLPMLSMFNETIKKAAKFTYSEQISILLNRLEDGMTALVQAENVLMILLNMGIALICFLFAYKKSGLS